MPSSTPVSRSRLEPPPSVLNGLHQLLEFREAADARETGIVLRQKRVIDEAAIDGNREPAHGVVRHAGKRMSSAIIRGNTSAAVASCSIPSL